MLRTIYHMLKDGTCYQEHRVEQRQASREQQANRLLRRLARLGFAAEIKPVPSPRWIGALRPSGSDTYTVATGVTGEPTAPGRRSGGAVRRKRLRLLARSQSASSESRHSSPRFTPVRNRQC